MILLRLFWEFFKTGLFAVGGGMATIPFLSEMAERTGWFTQGMLADMIAVGESTPGPIGVNTATYVGYTTAGIPGGVVATLGLVTPSFIIILIVAKFYERFRQSRLVEGAMSGLRPAAIGLIAASLLSIGKTVFQPIPDMGWLPTAISAALFLIMSFMAFKKKHPILIIAISAVVGIAAGYALGL